jgi:outer membrane protein TolC
MQKILLTLSIIIITGAGVRAETISLEQARTLALANSRSLARYNLSLRSSVLDERSHIYSMLPSVSAEYSASMQYIDRDWGFANPVDTLNAGASVAVTQKIFEGGKSFIQKSINAIVTESVRKEALAEYFNVIDSADNAYYAALEAAASLEAAESSLQTAVSSLTMAEIRQASGMINQGDYLKALAEKETRENARNQARRNLSLNMAKFRTLTGFIGTFELEQIEFGSYDTMIHFLAEISDEDADALYSRFWEILVRENPSLARSALSNQRAEKSLSLAKRDYAPTLSATLFSTSLNYTIADGFSTAPGGGIALRGSIPLDFWVMNNRLEKSKIARESAALDYIGAETSLGTELQTALLNAFSQAGSVLSSRRSLEYAEKHFEYVMERYRLSQSSVSDLGEASSLLISSRNNLIGASYGFLQSLSKLRSLGAIDDEEKLAAIIMKANNDGND